MSSPAVLHNVPVEFSVAVMVLVQHVNPVVVWQVVMVDSLDVPVQTCSNQQRVNLFANKLVHKVYLPAVLVITSPAMLAMHQSV